MTVQRHTSFQTQRIACCQTCRGQAEGLTCGGECIPQFHSVGVRYEELETVLAGVAGTRQKYIYPGNGDRNGGVVFELTYRILI